MAVVGVLVDAQVGDQHDVVADIVAEIGEGELGDAVGVVGTAPERILVRRNPEQHDGP